MEKEKVSPEQMEKINALLFKHNPAHEAHSQLVNYLDLVGKLASENPELEKPLQAISAHVIKTCQYLTDTYYISQNDDGKFKVGVTRGGILPVE